MNNPAIPGLPLLADLYQRHPGLTEALSRAFAEAAMVCLFRHHEPPSQFDITVDSEQRLRLVDWTNPDERTLAAWNNADDATRDGAYAMSLSAVESELGMVAIARAETKTGADYYMGPPGASLELDLDDAIRLEVSGVDRGSMVILNRRLREKITQARNGDSDLPALAAVVGFQSESILIASVENGP